MTTLQPAEERARLFGRVYAAAQTKIKPLLEALIRTIDALGVGRSPDIQVFERNVRRVVYGFAHDPASAPQFTALRLAASPQVRQGLIASFFYKLGLDRQHAESFARDVMTLPKEALSPTGAGLQRLRYFDLRMLTVSAHELYERLREILSELSKPYSGTPGPRPGARAGRPSMETFADRGVEQTVDVLKMFPDMADAIYSQAGLTQVKGFPPTASGGQLTGDDAEFVNHVDELLEDEARWQMISAIGLLAAGIVLTVVTAGVAGPLVGMAVGGGLGLVQSGAGVMSAQSGLALARDAHRAGVGSEARIASLEGEVQGAWGMLVADVVTGGILGRVGGAGGASKIIQGIKTIAISGAGAGLGTATNPNVWASPDVVGILVKATVIGGVAGGVGSAAGQSLTRAGQRIMVGFSRADGELKVGARVSLATQGQSGETHLRGEIISVTGSRVRIATPHGEAEFNIDDVAIMKTIDATAAPRQTAEPRAVSRQELVDEVRAPRVQGSGDGEFDSVAAIEKPVLSNQEALQAMGSARLMSTSQQLMPRVQAEMERLGYRTKLVPVRHEPNDAHPDGGEHMALELFEAPGRLGTLMRRAGPAMNGDVRYIYDPIGLGRDGGAGLFDESLNAIRIGHPMMAFGHRGVVTPFFHELRHGRTAMRLGDASYPFHGKLFFGEKSRMLGVRDGYRDQFQLDEMYAYLKQAPSSARETSLANLAVRLQGRDALNDPRTRHSFRQTHAEGDAYAARGFARAVKTQVGDMLARIRANGSRVSTEAFSGGSYSSTIHKFKGEDGHTKLMIEYFQDGPSVKAIVSVEQRNAAGEAIDETHVALLYELRDAPPGYRGDASHSFVVRRMEAAVAATDDVIARAMRTRDHAQDLHAEGAEVWTAAN